MFSVYVRNLMLGGFLIILLHIACSVRAIQVHDADGFSFDNWLCGNTPNDFCQTNSTLSDVWSHIVHAVFERSDAHLSTEDGMRNIFKYFHSQNELNDSRLHEYIDSTVHFHQSVIMRDRDSQSLISGTNPYPYYAFIPSHVGTVIPGASEIEWQSLCFNSVKAHGALSNDAQEFVVHLEMTIPKTQACSDYYVVYTIANPMLKSFFFHGNHTFHIGLHGMTDAEKWDVMTNGVRFLLFKDDPIQIFHDIKNTASLFLQPLTHGIISKDATSHNLYFLEHYQGIRPLMEPRDPTLFELPADYIQSGDFIGVVRLDGLDPMLGWAMGSTTGHTVVALRSEDNTLYFCESTTKGAYWPKNGIQCTEYAEWITRAVQADYNVVVAPLRDDLRASFNATAAWEFFDAVKGVDYGYETLLFGWIDTIKENYPCLPPDFQSRCLSWEFIEIAFSYLEKKIPVVSRIFRQAWNHRLGTSNLTIPELYAYVQQHNITVSQIPTIPEQDGWLYRTTRDGMPVDAPSQVCCVFVCNIWKAGGVFDSINREINCAEQTNFDLYHLDLFEENSIGPNRPDICLMRDPNNQLCQLTGKYTLQLNDFNSADPYSFMHEVCPSEPPLYERPSDC